MSFVKSYGGRPESSHPYEQQDCSVRALAIATGMSYDASYAALGAAGRKPNKPFNLADWLGAGSIVADSVIERIYAPEHHHECNTLEEVAARLPHGLGAFIVRLDGHLTALIDGEVHDTHRLDETRPVRIVWVVYEDRG